MWGIFFYYTTYYNHCEFAWCHYAIYSCHWSVGRSCFGDLKGLSTRGLAASIICLGYNGSNCSWAVCKNQGPASSQSEMKKGSSKHQIFAINVLVQSRSKKKVPVLHWHLPKHHPSSSSAAVVILQGTDPCQNFFGSDEDERRTTTTQANKIVDKSCCTRCWHFWVGEGDIQQK